MSEGPPASHVIDSMRHADYAASYGLQGRLRSWILPFVSEGARVLDVGCYTGETSAFLKQERGCFVVGVDVSEDALAIARQRIDETIHCDLENPASLRDKLTGCFDVILALSVVEHVRYPEGLIDALTAQLAPDGLLLVAVPNVSHWSARLKFLVGRFEYKQSGLFDRGHLRFFNLHSARDLLTKPGLEIDQELFFVRLPLERALRRVSWMARVACSRLANRVRAEKRPLPPERYREAMRENEMLGLGKLRPNLLAWKLAFVCRRSTKPVRASRARNETSPGPSLAKPGGGEGRPAAK